MWGATRRKQKMRYKGRIEVDETDEKQEKPADDEDVGFESGTWEMER